MSTLRILAILAIAATTASAQADSKAPAAATGRYSGALRGVSAMGVSDATRFSGSIDIAPSANGHVGSYKVDIRLSSSGLNQNSTASAILQWSISVGRCGSRVQFLVPPAELPQLELRNGGNAEVSWEGNLNLAANASYQLMVYVNGLREQDMVACANLRYSAPKS